MERRRFWWPVAGGPSTVIWERVALLAIPSTRENCRSILVVNCDKRRGCTSDRSDRLTPIERFGLGHRGLAVTLKAMAQGVNRWFRNQSIYKQLGVSASDFRMESEGATWQACSFRDCNARDAMAE